MSAGPSVQDVQELPAGGSVHNTPSAQSKSSKSKASKTSFVMKSGNNTGTITDTFSLPVNFSPHVENALAEKAMMSRLFATFIPTIARAVFAVKRYPSAAEYDILAKLVVDKYPFMKSPLGCGYEHISLMMKARLKEFRCTPPPVKKQKTLPGADKETIDGEYPTSDTKQ
jgi:hypothetical protein